MVRARGAKRKQHKDLAERRPAEKVTGVTAVGIVVAYLFDIRDPEVLTALGVLVGLVPSAMTWFVELIAASNDSPVDARSEEYDFDAMREVGKLRSEGLVNEEEFQALKAEFLNLELQ